MLKKNSIHTVTITDTNNLGYGVCRIDNIVTFVKDGVTEDVLEIKIIKSLKDYSVARIEKILTPSRFRIDSPCPVSHRCGSCVYQNISYDYELELKKNSVKSAFVKAGLPDIIINDTITNYETSGYRNKAIYPVAEDGTIGYYANKSHNIIEHDICHLQSRAFDNIIAFIKKYLKKNPLKGLKYIYLRNARGTGENLLCFVANTKSFEPPMDLLKTIVNGFLEITAITINYNLSDTNVILGDETKVVYRNGYINDVLCGLGFRISLQSFYQINHDVTEMLYGRILDLARPDKGDNIVDLYCGIGTIGLYLASKTPGANLTGIEINPSSIENAKFNAEYNGITNASFICADASDASVDGADIIILDPPRKGCSKELIDRIGNTRVKKVVYVSCNPATLARDAVIFKQHGFTIGEVTPFDMFPRTGHVESVVLLSR